MQFQWLNEAETLITVTLEDGEKFGPCVGPAQVTVPAQENNAEYQLIVADPGLSAVLPYAPLTPPAADVRDANQRLDAGIAAAQPGMEDATQAQARLKRARTTEAELAALQAQVDALTLAMQSMLTAQLGKTPR